MVKLQAREVKHAVYLEVAQLRYICGRLTARVRLGTMLIMAIMQEE
jgi:hypothetical protein